MRTLFLHSVLSALPLLAQQTILLRPDAKVDPAAPLEKIEQRGTGGLNDRSITAVVQPSVTVYLPPKDRATGDAIVICPGGGYQHLAIDKEGHDVAHWLNGIGVAGIVLKYRLPGSGRFRGATNLKEVADAVHVAIEDAEDAVRLTRANAAKWNVNPRRVGLMGFSAGGHLGAMLGMLAPPESRPDFLVLGYPAVPPTLEVTASTPPTFLVAAADDPTVPAGENAARFFVALRKQKVPAELLIYSTGGHGFGIRETDKTSFAWPREFEKWLAENRRSEQ